MRRRRPCFTMTMNGVRRLIVAGINFGLFCGLLPSFAPGIPRCAADPTGHLWGRLVAPGGVLVEGGA
jgi:hypothetical protein